jgi:probable F420-dependent oxidoreductase
VLLAKQAASLDVLSHGRLALGVGVGWSREEFAALGIPFARRGARAEEYLSALRALWRDDVASFDGEFVSFSEVRVNPKPLRGRRIPVIVGGNSDVALRRVAQRGDGWYGFNLAGVDAVRERLAHLRECCRAVGRDIAELDLAASLRDGHASDIGALAELGLSELVLVETPPDQRPQVEAWASALANRWSAALR